MRICSTTMKLFHLFLPLLLINPVMIKARTPYPLSTSSRWIVDQTSGRRVKLACVNWPAHLQPMVAEGLDKQAVDNITKQIFRMGFNCVRLTWPLSLVDGGASSNVTVRRSFVSLGLEESLAGIQHHNPAVLNLTLLQAMKSVVSSLGRNNVMVILDNHISNAGWCCSNTDDNGFFGDKYFSPDVWISSLKTMAETFKNYRNVVGMSLRNELRGPRQNVKDWYRYMQMGAEAVHSANPNALVILSGLSFDTDLSYLSENQLKLSFTRKLVFELHWYGFTDGQSWIDGNPNQVCGRVVQSVMHRAGFLLNQGWPLFLSEFGLDQRGTNANDNRYFNCMLATAAELDLDWALWVLAGSYYLREGTKGLEEFYGLMTLDWSKPRNSSLLQRVQVIQPPFRGPGLSNLSPYAILFHPSTGLCVLRKSKQGFLQLGPCKMSEAWFYDQQLQALELKGKHMCLMADGVGKPAKIGFNCSSPNSKWELVSESKMHLASKTVGVKGQLCLDANPLSKLITANLCKCINSDKYCNPASQWFKIVQSTRKISGWKM